MDKLISFIVTMVLFEIAFLIGLMCLLNGWYFVGSVILFVSMAPLEQYYLDNL